MKVFLLWVAVIVIGAPLYYALWQAFPGLHTLFAVIFAICVGLGVGVWAIYALVSLIVRREGVVDPPATSAKPPAS